MLISSGKQMMSITNGLMDLNFDKFDKKGADTSKESGGNEDGDDPSNDFLR